MPPIDVEIDEALASDENDILALQGKLLGSLFENNEYDAQWVFSDDGGRMRFRSRIADDDGAYFVARAGGRIVGFITGGVFPDSLMLKQRRAYLGNVFVEEHLRRRRIGSRLIERFVQWVESRGVTNILVEVRADHEGTIALYKSLGFHNYELKLLRESRSPSA